MKIKFIESPKGRDYKIGEEVDFVGHIQEAYARKFIDRGWAEEVVAEKPSRAAARTVDPVKSEPEVKPKTGSSPAMNFGGSSNPT